MADWLQVKVRGSELSLQTYRLYACSVCDTSAAAAAVCGLWRYISVICLCLCLPSSLLWS